jgi:hypothetical protein
VPVPHHRLDFEFSPAALGERIVQAVLARDPVRAERAIVAALEIHGCTGGAERTVFADARRIGARLGPECAAAVAEAIDTCVNRREPPPAVRA